MKYHVSIPEKREIPFEDGILYKNLTAEKLVSIPEKREIPFEEMKNIITKTVKQVGFNP